MALNDFVCGVHFFHQKNLTTFLLVALKTDAKTT